MGQVCRSARPGKEGPSGLCVLAPRRYHLRAPPPPPRAATTMDHAIGPPPWVGTSGQSSDGCTIASCDTGGGSQGKGGDPSYLSLVTSGGRCTPCAAAILCTCWRSHGVRSCGISGPPPVQRASTRSVPRVRTHSVHPFTGATTISHHSPRRESTTTTAPAITAVTATVTTPPHCSTCRSGDSYA